MISRQNVLNTLAFLIIAMVLINLYTFVLMMSTMADNPTNKFMRRLKGHHNTKYDKDHAVWTVWRTEKPDDDDIELFEKPSVPATTIRFVRRNGRMVFYENPDARPLSAAEQKEVFNAVLKKLKAMRESPRKDVDLQITLWGRARRAFARSESSYGASLNANSPETFWRRIERWPFSDQVFLEASLGQILQFASRAKIMQAKCSRRGTQLKLNLILEGGQVALFKPKWYPRDIVLEGEVYGGKDRHFGEIAAFYLSQVLGYNNSPLTVGRTLRLQEEILPVSTNQLKNTFFFDKQRNHCFYGVCYYCSPKDPVCADGEQLEGALVLLMNQQIITVPNPWARTYKSKQSAPWETHMSYCNQFDLRKIDVKDRDEFLLDIIAVSVFDFLIGNGDRHHFDVLNNTQQQDATSHSKRVLLIDNGKSFGNPYEDYVDILAPLYQCCRLRKSLWTTLNVFMGADLGDAVDSLSKADPLYPLLIPEHLTALNERLKIVVAVVEYCIDNHSYESVIIKSKE